jgi:hypothetical protein
MFGYRFSASQLWRLHLLALITPVHSLNLLVRMLPEQKAWRRFAHLPSQEQVPDVRMMNSFRERVWSRWLASNQRAVAGTDLGEAGSEQRGSGVDRCNRFAGILFRI